MTTRIGDKTLIAAALGVAMLCATSPAASQATPRPAPPAPANTPRCAATPKESLRNLDNELIAYTRKYPNPGDSRGVQGQFQYLYVQALRGLDILSLYKSCLSPTDYDANHSQMVATRNSTKLACEKVARSRVCPTTWP